jgi:non-heme Fe2+,alpha-ketoglutarate-dependent halogenase
MNQEAMKLYYQQQGVIFPLPALNSEEILEAQHHYLSLCSPGTFILEGEQRVFGHLIYPWVSKLVSHPTILEKVSAIIGPNIMVWVSEFNGKAPNSPNFFSWHQDFFYWRHQYYHDLKNIPLVTVWLSLFDTYVENGCMQVIPGSHLQLLQHFEKPNQHNLLTRSQEIKDKVDVDKAIPVELKAGEFSIHHPLIHHASGPNRSSQHRVGLVIRYLSPEISPPIRPAYAWLVSGEDAATSWDHVAPINYLNEHQAQHLRSKSMHSVQSCTGAHFK